MLERFRMVPLGAAVGEADRRVAVALVFTLSVLLLLFGSGAIDGFDGQAMYLTTESLVRAGDLSISAPFGDAGLGGSYSRYGPALSVLGIVPFLLAMPLADWVGVPQVLERAAVASLMPIICACLVAALYMLARRLGGGARSSLLVACGALFGTFLLPYSHDFFSEPLTALGLTLALERALARRPGQAGLALGLAIVARPQAAVMIPFLLLVGGGGGRAVIRAFAAPAASIAGLALYNLFRFGDPLDTGYRVGFTTPLFEGLWGLTLSPAKSVFIFAPVALLLGPALWQLRRSGSGATLFLTANLMTTLLIAATWTAWEGGWAWGPRLLLPGLVPAIAALAPWMGHASWRRGAVVAVLIAGFVVSLPTVFVPTRAQQLDGNNFAPEIVRQAELIRPTVSKSIRSLGGVGPLERRKVVPLWHILVGRRIGDTTLLATIPVSGLLIVAFVLGLRATRQRLAGLP